MIGTKKSVKNIIIDKYGESKMDKEDKEQWKQIMILKLDKQEEK